MDFKTSSYVIEFFDFDVLHLQLNTPLFILVLVAIVMFFLNFWLFRPVLDTLDARRAHLEELGAATERNKGEIARLADEYEQKLEQARAEVALVRQDSRRETQEAVQAILYKARQEADAELRAALDLLQTEVARAKTELSGAAPGLAEKTASRIVNA